MKRTADVLYPIGTALEQTFRDRDGEVSDALGLAAAQRRAREQGKVKFYEEHGLSFATSQLLYNLETDADIRAARGVAVDEAEIPRMAEASRRALRETLGPERAEAELARARQFVAAHPKLAAVLERDGIDSRVEVVKALVDHVRYLPFT